MRANHFGSQVFHFSPPYNYTPRFLDGVAYGAGKSDTPVLRDAHLSLSFERGSIEIYTQMHKLVRYRCRPHAGQKFVARDQRFEFLGRIGDGAVGLVRKAQNMSNGQIVAVKVLAPDPKYIDPAAFDDVAERFKREGSRGSRLRDDNLVDIIAYEENANGTCFDKARVKNPFIIMEYVKGRTLESFIKKLGSRRTEGAPVVTKQTLTIAHRIAKALEYLHEKKLVHRDVKPANVFLSSSTWESIPSIVKLGDFGVTK